MQRYGQDRRCGFPDQLIRAETGGPPRQDHPKNARGESKPGLSKQATLPPGLVGFVVFVQGSWSRVRLEQSSLAKSWRDRKPGRAGKPPLWLVFSGCHRFLHSRGDADGVVGQTIISNILGDLFMQGTRSSKQSDDVLVCRDSSERNLLAPFWHSVPFRRSWMERFSDQAARSEIG
jgi:hypothetical protein